MKKELNEYLDRLPESRKNTVQTRHKQISDHEPDFLAVGFDSFNGYVVYGFEKKNLYIFESHETNNATYVFNRDWEELSQLTKRDIIKGELCYKRIIHSPNWEDDIEKLLK